MGPEWLAFVNGLLTVLGIIRNTRGQRRDLADRALTAIYAASNETKTYLAGLRRGKQRNLDKEGQLSHLWGMAAIPLRHFDADLAARCELKGEYWRNPEEWTVADINDAKIGLDRVFNESKALLMR